MPCPPPRPRPALLGPWALAACALGAACGVSNADICQLGIGKRQACDANLAFGAGAVATCQAQLDHNESNTCHNGANLLAQCLGQTPCADAASACLSQQEVVDLNCAKDPFTPN